MYIYIYVYSGLYIVNYIQLQFATPTMQAIGNPPEVNNIKISFSFSDKATFKQCVKGFVRTHPKKAKNMLIS